MPNGQSTAVSELVEALETLRTSSSQNNRKGDALIEWFDKNVGEKVAVSLIKDKKQIGNRFKEQRDKNSENTVFVFLDGNVLEKTAERLPEYINGSHRRVYFFLHDDPSYKMTERYVSGTRDPLYEIVGDQLGTPELKPLPAPRNSASGAGAVADPSPDKTSLINPNGKYPLELPLQLIVHGCPGSGKSHLLQQAAIDAHYTVRTVFHPSTRYTDFVGGLRPESVYLLDENLEFVGGEGELPGEPYVQYVVRPGPLLRAYRLACENPSSSVVLLIEELSRAVASEVFGDTLQLLDRRDAPGESLSGYSEYEIEAQPDIRSWLRLNSIAHEEVASGNMRFPPNLYLWATMNKSDQNARQLDSAFLRRWSKKYISYLAKGSYDESEVIYGGAKVSWGQLRNVINERLRSLEGISEDKFIGPYFVSKRKLSDPEIIYEDIWGYIWNDVLKSRAVQFFEGAETFAELERVWDSGNGRPIGDFAAKVAAYQSDKQDAAI